MESYELDPNKIINWGTNYASYEDLQDTAKALYGIFAIRRKKLKPQDHLAVKGFDKKIPENREMYNSMAGFNGGKRADRSSPKAFIESYIARMSKANKHDKILLIEENPALAVKYANGFIKRHEKKYGKQK